jgi:hypothetical protein
MLVLAPSTVFPVILEGNFGVATTDVLTVEVVLQDKQKESIKIIIL